MLALAPLAAAQGPADGALQGRILDAHGAPLSGALIVLTPSDLPASDATPPAPLQIAAQRDGTFSVVGLPPGAYRVRSGAAESLVQIDAGEVAEVTLAPAHAATPADRPQSTLGEGIVISAQDLRSLPVELQDWEQLAALDPQLRPPAAAPASGDDEEDQASGQPAPASLADAGIAAIDTRVQVDGLSARQSFSGTPLGTGSAGLRSSYSAAGIAWARVRGGGGGALLGGPGVQLTIVSRAATAALHGTAFLQLRRSGWAATNPFALETHYRDGIITAAPVRPGGELWQLGGSVSGPLAAGLARLLPHSHAAPPASLHWLQQHSVGAVATLQLELRNDRIVSSPSLASFYQLTPTQLGLLGTRGVSAAQSNAALDYLDSLSGATQRHAQHWSATLRLDAAFGERNRASLAWQGRGVDAPAGVATGQAAEAVVARGRGSLGDRRSDVQALSAQATHRFAPGWVAHLRAQFSRDLEQQQPRPPLPQEPAIGPGGLAPQVSIAPQGFAFGTPLTLGRSAYPDEQRIELTTSTELRLGRHLLTLGGSWSRVQDHISDLSNGEGSFSYDSSGINGHAGGLVDWITDYSFNVNTYPNGACPSITAPVHDFCFRSYTQSFGAVSTRFITHEFAGYVQDAWRLRPNLSLRLGLRYEYQLLPLPQQANPVLDGDLAAVGFNGATARLPEDRNNAGPQLGLAWSPIGRRSRAPWFTLHAAYGAYFGMLPGATLRAALVDTALPSTQTHIRITPSTELLCPQFTTNQPFGYVCVYTSAPPAAVAQTTSATVFAARFRLPAVQRASLQLQRALGQHLQLQAQYNLAAATQLPQSVDVNIAPAQAVGSWVLQGGDGHPGLHSGETFVLPLYTQRLITQYGPVTALESHANATYHAATLRAAYRRGPWQARASYTFSRTIDYAPQAGASPGLNGQLDPFRNRYDKGLSNQNLPQRLSALLLARLRWRSGPPLLRAALNGWQAAAIATAGSGRPYSYQLFGGSRLSGGRETINGSGGATYLPTVGRNTLHLPANGSVDLRLSRDLPLGPRAQLALSAQAFNLTNTQSVSRVETRAFVPGTPANPGAPVPLLFQDAAELAAEGLPTPAFGTPLSSSAGLSRERQLELGLRVRF